jgi:hypothetical protein
MARKPEPPPQPTKWTISKFAAKLQWIGEIEARDEHDAIVKAAKQFKLPASKLIAARRR